MIRRRIFSPTTQSIRHTPKGKEMPTLSIGIVEPGKQDFGVVNRNEVIRVTSGAIEINGALHAPGDEDYVVQPGTQVVFETETVSSYICLFPGESR